MKNSTFSEDVCNVLGTLHSAQKNSMKSMEESPTFSFQMEVVNVSNRNMYIF